jgi:hypothetical protein
MDSVRFGRALGTGARAAAKALMQAADAAATPKPAAQANQPHRPAPQPARPAPSRVLHKAAETVVRSHQTGRGVREGSRRFGQAVWAPAVRVTSVVWLEVMGVFFSLFAIVGCGFCWSHRAVIQAAFHGGNPHVPPADQRSFVMMAAMALLFGYFCISSFVRARRRSRR